MRIKVGQEGGKSSVLVWDRGDRVFSASFSFVPSYRLVVNLCSFSLRKAKKACSININ